MATDDFFDLIVVGAGPGGYVAAIRAAQLGMKVLCVEKEKTLGGTCLNIGCIPSKALLDSSELYHQALHDFKHHGIKAQVELDLQAMMKRKTGIIQGLTRGISALFKKNKIVSVQGLAQLVDATTVRVQDSKLTQDYRGKRILLATGSVPVNLPDFPMDEKRIVSSTGALSLSEVPKHLVVIGGGVIGLELGSVWRRLGAEVTVIEVMDHIFPGMEAEISKEMLKILKREGFKFHLETRVERIHTLDQNSLKVIAAGKVKIELDCDVVLVCVGRRPYSDGLGLDEVGVKKDKRGFVSVDSNFQTSIAGVYAIGDLIPGPMLAHKAEEEGVAAVERMQGHHAHVDYTLVPGVVYTHPEIAAVGLTTEQAEAKGLKVRSGKFPFMASGRARALNETRGFIKVIADEKTDQVLGVHMLGPRVSELIAEAAIAMEYGASAEDIARTCHAHPTLSEVLKEAALAVDKRAIHM
jgi:dihydrolipoamide dehydrogenase